MDDKIEIKSDSDTRVKITNIDRVRKVGEALNISATQIANFLVNTGIEALERATPLIKEEIKKAINKKFKLK